MKLCDFINCKDGRIVIKQLYIMMLKRNGLVYSKDIDYFDRISYRVIGCQRCTDFTLEFTLDYSSGIIDAKLHRDYKTINKWEI